MSHERKKQILQSLKNDWVVFGKIYLSPDMGWRTESRTIAVFSGTRTV